MTTGLVSKMTGEFQERRGLSWRGRVAAALFALNTVLLFFPPIPPYVKGSLWSYVLKTVVVLLAMLETYRMAGPVAGWWDDLTIASRWKRGLGASALLLAVALTLRNVAPDLSDRFSAEVGPWETITTACYACGLVLLWRVGDAAGLEMRRHLRLVAGGFGLLLLEETDYGGVIGGLVGRIDGVYVGSLHDLINLAAEGQLPPLAVTAIGLVGLVGAAALWRGGHIRPRLVARTLFSVDGVWLGLGFLALIAAALGEAGMLGASFAGHSPEEAIEMAGGVCLAVFALQVAGRAWTPEEAGASGRREQV